MSMLEVDGLVDRTKKGLHLNVVVCSLDFGRYVWSQQWSHMMRLI